MCIRDRHVGCIVLVALGSGTLHDGATNGGRRGPNHLGKMADIVAVVGNTGDVVPVVVLNLVVPQVHQLGRRSVCSQCNVFTFVASCFRAGVQ